MDADRRGGVEEGGVERLLLLGESSSVVRAVGGGHLLSFKDERQGG